jgi:hypothetical protein
MCEVQRDRRLRRDRGRIALATYMANTGTIDEALPGVSFVQAIQAENTPSS